MENVPVSSFWIPAATVSRPWFFGQFQLSFSDAGPGSIPICGMT